MSYPAPARLVEPRGSTLRYQRHRPEQTLLLRIVAQHDPRFVEHVAGQSRPLPDYVQREFRDDGYGSPCVPCHPHCVSLSSRTGSL